MASLSVPAGGFVRCTRRVSYSVRKRKGREGQIMKDAGAGGGDRPGLSREKVLEKALELVDRDGIAALSIRSLAQKMGTKPMTLYYYVANKDQILDGLVDIVFTEIETPEAGGEWKDQMRRRAHSAREVLRRHPWAVGLLESRKAPGP